MQPSTQLTTLRPDIRESLAEFDTALDREGFVSNKILTPINTTVQSSKFGKIPIEELLKSPDTKRTSRSNYNRGDWTFTDDSFATKEYGFEEPVDERDARIYGEYFDAEVISAELALDAVVRSHEDRASGLLFNPSTFTGAELTTAVTNEWDDAENATPLQDVEAAVRKIFEATGMWPNSIAFNRRVFRRLRLCEQIIDAIRSAGAGSATKARDITVEQLSAVFDLQVIVAGGVKNIANEAKDAVISQIWSDEYAMVCRVAQTNNIKEPCIGRTFHYTGDGSDINGTVESYEEPARRGHVIRVRHEVDQKILNVKFGHLLSNITTTT